MAKITVGSTGKICQLDYPIIWDSDTGEVRVASELAGKASSEKEAEQVGIQYALSTF